MATKKIGSREGAGLPQGNANTQQSSDRELWDALRDEMTALEAAAAVTQANALAPGASYVQAEAASAADLANALKTAMNAMAAVVKTFAKK